MDEQNTLEKMRHELEKLKEIKSGETTLQLCAVCKLLLTFSLDLSERVSVLERKI
jgi:hypothetical protein